MEQRISAITLGVADLDRARAFYTALGWEPGFDEQEVVFFQAGGLVVALWSRERLAQDAQVADPGGWGGVTIAHNVRSRAEVDAVVEQARAAGGHVTREPAETFYGGYQGIYADPDGHTWEIAHNPGWTIEADGSTRLSAP